jgi:hypothetical protein
MPLYGCCARVRRLKSSKLDGVFTKSSFGDEFPTVSACGDSCPVEEWAEVLGSVRSTPEVWPLEGP